MSDFGYRFDDGWEDEEPDEPDAGGSRFTSGRFPDAPHHDPDFLSLDHSGEGQYDEWPGYGRIPWTYNPASGEFRSMGGLGRGHEQDEDWTDGWEGQGEIQGNFNVGGKEWSFAPPRGVEMPPEKQQQAIASLTGEVDADRQNALSALNPVERQKLESIKALRGEMRNWWPELADQLDSEDSPVTATPAGWLKPAYDFAAGQQTWPEAVAAAKQRTGEHYAEHPQHMPANPPAEMANAKPPRRCARCGQIQEPGREKFPYCPSCYGRFRREGVEPPLGVTRTADFDFSNPSPPDEYAPGTNWKFFYHKPTRRFEMWPTNGYGMHGEPHHFEKVRELGLPDPALTMDDWNPASYDDYVQGHAALSDGKAYVQAYDRGHVMPDVIRNTQEQAKQWLTKQGIPFGGHLSKTAEAYDWKVTPPGYVEPNEYKFIWHEPTQMLDIRDATDELHHHGIADSHGLDLYDEDLIPGYIQRHPNDKTFNAEDAYGRGDVPEHVNARIQKWFDDDYGVGHRTAEAYDDDGMSTYPPPSPTPGPMPTPDEERHFKWLMPYREPAKWGQNAWLWQVDGPDGYPWHFHKKREIGMTSKQESDYLHGYGSVQANSASMRIEDGSEPQYEPDLLKGMAAHGVTSLHHYGQDPAEQYDSQASNDWTDFAPAPTPPSHVYPLALGARIRINSTGEEGVVTNLGTLAGFIKNDQGGSVRFGIRDTTVLSPAPSTTAKTASSQMMPLERVLQLVGPQNESWRTPGWEGMREDIRQNGIKEPIEIGQSGDNYWIEDGSHRLGIAQDLGLPTVPVTFSRIAKTAAGQVMYHGRRREDREHVLQHGIAPQRTWRFDHKEGWDDHDPGEATYLATTPEEAAHWAGAGGDVYEVNVAGLGSNHWPGELGVDPYSYNENGEDENYYTNEHIGPERLRLLNEGTTASTHDNTSYVKLGMPTDPAIVGGLTFETSQHGDGGTRWVARFGGFTVGELDLGPTGEVAGIWVDPAYRHKGVATAMFQHLDSQGIDYEHNTSFTPAGKGMYDSMHPGAEWEEPSDPRFPTEWTRVTHDKLADSYYDNEAPWFIDTSGKLHVGNWGQLHKDIGAGDDYQAKGIVQKSGAVTVFSSYDSGWGEAMDKPAIFRQVAPQLEMQLGIKVHEIGESDWAAQALGDWDLPSMPPKEAADAGQLQDFFEQAAQGQRAPVNPLGPEDLSQHPEHIDWRNAWDQHAGPFDYHIETSIPGYAQNMTAKGTALMKAFPGSSVLDIAASHGSFGKTLSQLGGMPTTSLDPSPEFRDQFHATPVDGAEYSQTAFGPGFTDNHGQVIESYPHENKHDIVHESMAFQFIDPDRDSQVGQAKQHLNPGGLAIFDEKFNQSDPDQYWANEAKKDKWKLKHYPQDALDAKTEEVGLKGGGMSDMQANYDDFHALLQEHFKYVSPYWKSGNFAGFAASDNPHTLQKYLDAYGQEAQAASKAPVAAPNGIGGGKTAPIMPDVAAGLRTASGEWDFSAPFNPETGADDHGTWDWRKEVPEWVPKPDPYADPSKYFADRAPWMMDDTGEVRMGKFGEFHEDLWPGFQDDGEYDDDGEWQEKAPDERTPYARGAVYPRNGQFVNVVYNNRGLDPYQDNLYEGQEEKTRESIRRGVEKAFGHPLVHPERQEGEGENGEYPDDDPNYADSSWADKFPGQEGEVKRWSKTAEFDWSEPISPEPQPEAPDRARFLYNHGSGQVFLYPDSTRWGGHHNEVFDQLKERNPEQWPGMFGWAQRYPDTSGGDPERHRLTEGGYVVNNSDKIFSTWGGAAVTRKGQNAIRKAWKTYTPPEPFSDDYRYSSVDNDDTDWGYANAPERVDPQFTDNYGRSNWLDRIPYAMYDDGSTEIGKFGQMHHELPGGQYGSRKRSVVRGGIYPRGQKWVHAIYTNGGTKLEGDPDFGEELKLGVDPATVTSKLSEEFGRPIEQATGENEAASSGWGYKAGDPTNFDWSEPMQAPGQKTAGSREDFAGAPGWASVPGHVYDWLDRMYPQEEHGVESDCINPKCHHDWTDEEAHELAQYGEIKCPTCGLLQNREGRAEGAAALDASENPRGGRPGGQTRSGLTMRQQGQLGEQIVSRIGELPSGQITHHFNAKGEYNNPVDFLTQDEAGNPWGVEVKTIHSQGSPRFKLGNAQDVRDKRDYCAQNGLRPALVGVRLNYYTDKADIFYRPQLTDPYASDRNMTHVGSVDFGDLNPFKTPTGENQVPEQPVAVGFGDDLPY